MLKQAAIYFVLSIMVVLFTRYVHLAVVYIAFLFTYCNVFMTLLIDTPWLQKTLLLIILPLVMTSVPAIFFQWITKKKMPYHLELTWTLWLVLVTSSALIH